MARTELSLNDQAFVKEYVRTRNATRAYQATHPRAKSTGGARVNAHRKLMNANVHHAVRQHLDLNDLKDELRWCVDQSKQQKNVKELRGSVMDLAKLSGLIVDKAEVKAISDEEVEQLRRVALSALTPSTS